MRVATFRYHARSLIDRHILRPLSLINPFALGYYPYCVYFNLSSLGRKKRECVLESLARNNSVSWLASLGGSFQYCARFLAKTPSDVLLSLSMIQGTLGGVFAEKAISPVLAHSFFPAKFAHATREPEAERGFSADDKVCEIDSIDARILKLFANNECGSMREIARRLGLPSSTVDDRIKRLQSKRVLLEGLYVLNEKALGMTSCRLLVKSSGFSPKGSAAFFDFLKGHSYVSSMFYCLGSWDCEVQCLAADGDIIERLVSEIETNFGDEIIGIEQIFVHQKLKENSFPFDSAADDLRAAG